MQDRFAADNMYYPPEAGQYINDGWREQMQLNQPREYDIDELMQQRYEQVQRELDEKFREFEGQFPEQQYREYVAPLPEPEYAREARQPEYSKKARPGFFDRLRKFFRRRGN